MAPNIVSEPLVALTNPVAGRGPVSTSTGDKKNKEYKVELVWKNVIMFTVLHLCALYGVFLALTKASWTSVFMGFFGSLPVILGITAGAHRLWSHRAYKVNTPLKIVLLYFQLLSSQNSLHEWVRDHRLHHKFSETDADPHNSKRGFFFSHMGWLCCRKHPDVKEKGKTIDMTDLEADPYVMFQKKYYIPLVIFNAGFLSVVIPMYFWGETFECAFYGCTILRITVTLHMTWLVNSAAHMWGNKPYDKNIGAVENLTVTCLTGGEGWHNYHHVFAWDYKAAELGGGGYNFTTSFIDWCAKYGWAYDLKTVPLEVLKNRVKRTGDGTHPIWGWDDKEMTPEDKQLTEIRHEKTKNNL